MTYIQRLQERAARLRSGGMVILLVLLVITVFVLPVVVTSNSVIDRIAQDVLLSSILVSGVVAASDRSKGLAWIALVMLVAIVVRWMGWLLPNGPGLVIRDEVKMFSLTLLGALMGTKVFGAGTVTRNRIGGAVVLYMLVGLVCADAYQLISIVVPGSFVGTSTHDRSVDRSTWVYFSFVTLTTVGYGDITPVARAARSLSNLEALIGQLYPAIVLARLVSLQVAGRGSGSNKS
ncbi:ion channel [Paraburkholderia sp. MMS20-SJTN17]|uniref:Ion channel n=1 Tax=Paraburkholderia translucens TaxID=2886945 RepID=A0ABS8KHE4_9BURK|nr:potassium channel family protein [Paraburkholderia sp. MMS20-SJTN17]MCC8404125.1 ion channel [Paraburkholderia sp. MMS20-SJTN17]